MNMHTFKISRRAPIVLGVVCILVCRLSSDVGFRNAFLPSGTVEKDEESMVRCSLKGSIVMGRSRVDSTLWPGNNSPVHDNDSVDQISSAAMTSISTDDRKAEKQSGTQDINDDETDVQIRPSWANVSRESIDENALSKIDDSQPSNFSSVSIDRIYYINLEKNSNRKMIMEDWLSKQPIPYQRVPAMRGEPDLCVENKLGKRCIGISGLARTNVYIMDNLNTTGITLVIEDDFVITDMDKLLASIQLIPNDWDVLRWDCWGKPLPNFGFYPFSHKLLPKDMEVCAVHNRTNECWYGGGTHVVMWKTESVEKLRKLWATQPHNDIDLLLSGSYPLITSYCINVGIGEFHQPKSERSDIGNENKADDPQQRKLFGIVA